jgi:hypothetical protein
MTRHLDPDRRRPAPQHPGYDPRELDVDMEVCRWCGGLVPADERQRVKHEEWEQRIAARFLGLFDAVGRLSAAVAHLSDLGSRATPSAYQAADASPGSDPSSGAGEAGGRPVNAARAATGPVAERPAPDTNVPTPAQEATAGRAGVADANQRTQPDAAGLPPSGVAPTPEPSPPDGSGVTNRSRPEGPGSTTGRLPLNEPPDYGRFTR